MSNYKDMLTHVRLLRRNMTSGEKALWDLLKNRQFFGLKFLRQYPIVHYIANDWNHYFVADFYCHEHKLVIELDGPIHDQQVEYDQWRDEVMKNLGLKVLRLSDDSNSSTKTHLQEIAKFLNLGSTDSSVI